jgi:hypothetical protein
MTNALALGRQEHLTFKGNLKESRYGWLRLTPAYSVNVVTELLDDLEGAELSVLDPYCGTGTTSLVCAERGLPSTTTDINPFLVWLARAKTASYSPEHIDALQRRGGEVAATMRRTGGPAEWIPNLHQIDKWWDAPTLHALGRGMAAIRRGQDSKEVADLLLLAFCRTLIERASVSFGHQSMSFKKRKEQEALLPEEALVEHAALAWDQAVETLVNSAPSPVEIEPTVLLCDARNLSAGLKGRQFGAVITSPPYPNRMSYIRELRPYMYWLGYLSDGREAGELDWLAIGGTWGCATSNVGRWEPDALRPIPHPGFQQIIAAIGERSDLLSRYVHKYFFDMVGHLSDLAKVVAPGGSVHYIVGNSKFYDVMLPVQDIYAGMLAESGFDEVQVKAIRKRSSKRELFEYVVSARRGS